MYSFDIVKNLRRQKKLGFKLAYDTIEHRLVFISRMIMHPINEYIYTQNCRDINHSFLKRL